MLKHKKPAGFTLVELLIVIVIIAILAAISIVTYRGIQQRAKNTAVIQSAQSWVKVLSLSYTAQGTIYVTRAPGDHSICLGRESDYPPENGLGSGECLLDYAHTNEGLVDAIESVSSVTTNALYTDDFRGLQYGFSGGTWNIYYELFGEDQDCGLPGAHVGTTAPSGFTGCMIEVSELIGGPPVAFN